MKVVFIEKRGLEKIDSVSVPLQKLFSEHSAQFEIIETSKSDRSRAMKDLKALLQYTEADVAICMDIDIAGALASLKGNSDLEFMCYLVHTDYFYPDMESVIGLDGLFLPHVDLVKYSAKKAIHNSKIHFAGIPMPEGKMSKIPKSAARKIIGIAGNDPVVMIMGCGLEDDELSLLICRMVANCKASSSIIVLCRPGFPDEVSLMTNSCLKRVRFICSTMHLGIYLDACDVLVSKAKGSLITLSAIKNIPMVLLPSACMAENENARFFHNRNLAVHASDMKNAAHLAGLLDGNSRKANLMRKAQQDHIESNASEKIYRRIMIENRRG